MILALPDALRGEIARAARDAFPRECCGLIEGARDGESWTASALHPARNLATSADRFEIDPADHFRAQRMARANGGMIIGCYHSHPNGNAEPSARDGEGADGFLWLIAALTAHAPVTLSAWRRDGAGWCKIEIAETGSVSPHPLLSSSGRAT